MLSFPAVACTVRLGRPCFFFPGRSRSRIPTPSGPGPKVSAIRPPFMCAFCIPCASPGLPRPVVPQSIPTSRPPIRATVRAIPNAQYRVASGLTPLLATLPENPPVSLIIATLPKSGSRNPFVCHTYETPPGGLSPSNVRTNPRSRAVAESGLYPRSALPGAAAGGDSCIFPSCQLCTVGCQLLWNRARRLFPLPRVTSHESPVTAVVVFPNSYSPFPNFPTCKPFPPATIDRCP